MQSIIWRGNVKDPTLQLEVDLLKSEIFNLDLLYSKLSIYSCFCNPRNLRRPFPCCSHKRPIWPGTHWWQCWDTPGGHSKASTSSVARYARANVCETSEVEVLSGEICVILQVVCVVFDSGLFQSVPLLFTINNRARLDNSSYELFVFSKRWRPFYF